MNQIINTNTITHDINNFKAVFSQDRKIIGLDVGKKTIGIAISDPTTKIALTHKTIFRKKLKEDLQMIQEIINDNAVVSIVIGLPLNKDGTKGPIAQSVITFSHILLKAFKLPILLWDERFSTIGILREMKLAGVKKKNIEKKIDSASATWILQGALDSMKE
jgi:putative Holliday junction resolvase